MCNKLFAPTTRGAGDALVDLRAGSIRRARKPFGPIINGPKTPETAKGDRNMLKKTLVIGTIATAVAAATLPTPASAGDPVLGALVGGGIGAAIGHGVNGRNGAWVGGTIGALTGASIAANSGYYNGGYDNGGYYGPPATYSAPAPVYYGGSATYYSPPPVYYAPPVVVVRPRPVYGYGYAPRYGYGY